MAYILSIETSSINCSVSLFENDQLLICIEQDETYMHSEKLHSFIDQLMKESNLRLNQLQAIAVSAGPGSYTGLRIGASAAKGLCFALEIPLIAVPTLKIISTAALNQLTDGENYEIHIPLIDARRMEVYSCSFDKHLNVVSPLSNIIMDEQSFSKELEEGEVLFYGSGMEKMRSLFIDHKKVHFLDDVPTSSRFMGALVYEKFQANEFEDMAYFEPLYHKNFIATTPKKLL